MARAHNAARQIVTVEPLRIEHHDGLVEAVKDGELWNLWYTKVPSPDAMRRHRATPRPAAKGSMLPFTVIDNSTRRIVGATTYMNIDAENRRVEIGSTWYAQSVQRTGLNTECKHLLLTHAFDTLDCIAVEFRTSHFNRTSRRAIERLGAKLDGILRSHQLAPHGSLQDTCVHSIIAAEWPGVRANLDWMLRMPRTPRAFERTLAGAMALAVGCAPRSSQAAFDACSKTPLDNRPLARIRHRHDERTRRRRRMVCAGAAHRL